jgi:hypothetical protein
LLDIFCHFILQPAAIVLGVGAETDNRKET